MKCNICEQTATVFLEQLVDGKVKKMALCSACAEQHGVAHPQNFSLDAVFQSSIKNDSSDQDDVSDDGSQEDDFSEEDLFDDEGAQGEGDHHLPSVAEMDLVCDQCGFTITELRKLGRLGCPECYGAFRVAMAPMLESMHKGVKHEGKAPEGSLSRIRQVEQLKQLESALGKAIQHEAYEDAVKLRDEIRVLKTEMEAVS